MPRHDIVVVGASAGGLEALKALLGGLPRDFDAAVFIVWHIAPDSPGFLPDILQRITPLRVANATENAPIAPGHVYLAPPDHHLLIEQGRVRITRGPKENLCRPAVDPLFRSAALAYGPQVIGVILSGRLDDGSAGLWAVKQRGGVAVVQDPQEALYPSMPSSALQYVAVDHCLPVAEIGPLLGQLNREPALMEGIPPVSKELELETQIALEDNALELGVMNLGPFTPYTCPECHGVLVQAKQGGIPRFRCHTGHAYSLSSLLSEVTGAIEETLWSAVRAIEESQLLLQDVAHQLRASEDANYTDAVLFEQKAREAQARASLIRQALLSQERLSAQQPANEPGAAGV